MSWIQKRKPDDSENQPLVKKIKSESKPRHSKVVKEKKTPKLPKKQKQVISTPAPSSAAARRSSRGTSARKSYADRGSDEDEAEMMVGVAQWKYVDEDSDNQSGDEEDVEEQDVEQETLGTPQPVEEPEPMDEDTPEAEEEEAEPMAPRSLDRKSKTVLSKKSTPVVKARAKVAKQKSKSPPVAAKAIPKSPAMPKIKAKSPLVSRPKTKGKGKGKGKASDIYDVEESE
jgi:sister-chromatid-cohesion protein PDS5